MEGSSQEWTDQAVLKGCRLGGDWLSRSGRSSRNIWWAHLDRAIPASHRNRWCDNCHDSVTGLSDWCEEGDKLLQEGRCPCPRCCGEHEWPEVAAFRSQIRQARWGRRDKCDSGPWTKSRRKPLSFCQSWPAVRCLIAAREAPRRCAMKWGFLSLVRCPWIRNYVRRPRKGGHALLIRDVVPVRQLFGALWRNWSRPSEKIVSSACWEPGSEQ
jgi:hypothetical protein